MTNKFEEYCAIGYKGKVGLIDRIPQSYKNGTIIVSAPFPFIRGKPQSIMVGAMEADSITITNTSTNMLVLRGINVYASSPKDSFLLSMVSPPTYSPDNQGDFRSSHFVADRILCPFQTLNIWLICCPKEVGAHRTTVNFSVGDDRIELVVFLLAKGEVSKAVAYDNPPKCISNKKEEEKKKMSSSLFSEARFKSIFNASNSFDKSHGAFEFNTPKYMSKRLKPYPILNEDREFVASTQMSEFLFNGLSRRNYASYFRTLVILEELALEEEMNEFDMKFVPMKKKDRFLSLEVPGLTEDRLSLVPGSIVHAELPTQDQKKVSICKATVKLVGPTSISLKFSKQFHRLHSDDNLYNISFSYNRINFRRIYQAIEVADQALSSTLLFPSHSDAGEIRWIQPATTSPICDTLNEEQRRAVNYILGCSGGAPYVIYGPPGTGKTKTLVELILQLYKTKPNSRILVSTSSNCAADHILERIVGDQKEQVKEDEILRLNAKSRPRADVDPSIIKYCYVHQDLVFGCPPIKDLRRYRIVVSTYVSVNILYGRGISRGHFSNIILDEAGQATEPDTMIPIAHLSGRDTTVVLAGDPKQLGPVVQSRKAEMYGLGKSFLERLCESEIYRRGDPNYVTMLVKNYRCHPEILALPSKMFYDDMLIAAKEEPTVVVSGLPWGDMLLNRDFPVIFYGVEGQNMKEGSNPSWFNSVEMWKVIRIVRTLIARKIGEQNIGVIAPYKQQVTKIKRALGDLGLNGVQVGSVEQFQGQEKEVIIVSTVRSTLKHDGFGGLGFLSSPKRFNVAVTRARSLLVIVGNPYTIAKDPCWGRLLWHCVDHGSFQGCSLPKRNRRDYMEGDKLAGRDNVSTVHHSGQYQNKVSSAMGSSLVDELQKRLNHLSIH